MSRRRRKETSFNEIASEYSNTALVSPVGWSLRVRDRRERPTHTANLRHVIRGRRISIAMYFLTAKILQPRHALSRRAQQHRPATTLSFSKHRDRLSDVTSWRESLLPAYLLRLKAAPEGIPGSVVLSFLQSTPTSHVCGGYERAI